LSKFIADLRDVFSFIQSIAEIYPYRGGTDELKIFAEINFLQDWERREMSAKNILCFGCIVLQKRFQKDKKGIEMKKSPLEVLAYYFPNWHVDPLNEQVHGTKWTEWSVVQCARPRFEGHRQPRVPLWGYEDESDPAVMGKKIACAVEHGITGFIFDWYYSESGPFRQKMAQMGIDFTKSIFNG
jgi:hypothetical protein